MSALFLERERTILFLSFRLRKISSRVVLFTWRINKIFSCGEACHTKTSCALFPHIAQIQQQHKYSHKPSLYSSSLRCQQMSMFLHVLWTNNICLDRLDFFVKLFPHWLHCSDKQARMVSGRWSGALGSTK